VTGKEKPMRRRAKPARAEVEAKPSAAGESRKSEGSTVHDLEKQPAEALRGKAEALGQLQTRDRELAEAQEEQTATSEILRIISQFQAREVLVRAGYRAALAVPLVREDHLLGGLTVFRKTPGEFAPESSTCCGPSLPSPPWPSRMPGCSSRSRIRAGSSKSTASTS
jgi:hypothetical protein